MTLLNTTTESETRKLTRIGMVSVLVITVATVLYFVVNPFGRKPQDVISVGIATPYVGQGVTAGTPVIMHGVKIGEVTSVSSIAGGGARLKADLQPGPARGLTDAMGIDYRPSNYFGVTGLNVIPAQNGTPLRSGMQINIMPKGNFTLQALLYRLGELSNGVLNQRLISVIERGTRYVDGFEPLLETALIVATSVAKVQTVSTEQLLRNTTGISVAFPSFIDALSRTGNLFRHSFMTDTGPEDLEKLENMSRWFPALGEEWQKIYHDNMALWLANRDNDEYYKKHWFPLFTAAQHDLFTPVGVLESSHANDLFPIIEEVRAVLDAVPKVFSAEKFGYTLTELRSRFERMYAGSGDQRALQVRIILDRIPAVAGPLGFMMGAR